MYRLIHILILGILIIFTTFGCQTLQTGNTKMLQPVKVELIDLETIHISKKECKEPIVMDMLFSIANPNPYPVTVSALEWTVRIEGTRLGALAVQESQYIPAGQETEVRKTYFLNAKMGAVNLLLAGAVVNLEEGASLFGGICNSIKEERAMWKLDGAAYMDSKSGSASAPFSIQWKMSKPPK